jgi:hypothetical protein
MTELLAAAVQTMSDEVETQISCFPMIDQPVGR